MTRDRAIPIRSDKGFDICQDCAYIDTDTCTFCDFGDQFEESDGEGAEDRARELMAA